MATDISARLIIQAINNASPVLKAIGGDLGSLRSTAAAVASAIGSDFVKGFIEANSELDKMKRSFDAIAGAGVGKLEYDRLTDTANKLGISLDALSSSYTQLKAASIGTAMEGKNADDAFNSLAGAMSVLGANTQQTKMAFLAVSQMVSKGTVSMEELRRQLAQHLPGAIQIFARALNVSTSELYKLVKAGKVGIPEMMKFFKQINQEYDPEKMKVSSYEQNIARLENAFKTLNTELGATGAWQLFTDAAGLAASTVNSVAESIQSDATKMGAVWESWGIQFKQIMDEADVALNGFLTDFKNNAADTAGIAYSIAETARFIGDAFKNMPINIKTSIIVLMSEVGQGLISIRSLFETLWAYVASSGESAVLTVKVAFQAVIAEINSLLANMTGTLANNLEALGKSGDFIPGFKSSVTGIVAGLRSMESASLESAKRLQELKSAQEDVGKGYETRKAQIEATANTEKAAWQEVANAALESRDKQIQAQNELVNQRTASAQYDREEQALWARRVENIHQATAAIADQGKVSKVTADIMKEITSIGQSSTRGGASNSKDASVSDTYNQILKTQQLRNELTSQSSDAQKQEYLDALKLAEANAKSLQSTKERADALSILAMESYRLKEAGIIPDETTKASEVVKSYQLIKETIDGIPTFTQKFDLDTAPAKEKIEAVKSEANGVPAFTQVDANTELAQSKIGGLIQWANDQRVTIPVTFTKTNSPTAGYATGGLVGGIGNSDSVRALLTPGEFVLTKSAVQRLGVPYLNGLNHNRKRSVDNLHIPSVVPRYASGGLVNSDTVNHVIELRIGGNKHIIAMGSRDAVRKLNDDLTKLGRAI